MRQFPSPFDAGALPASPVHEMAEQLREAHAAKGFAEIHDLVVIGWPQAAIERHGPDAVVLAGRRASRDAFADLARAA